MLSLAEKHDTKMARLSLSYCSARKLEFCEDLEELEAVLLCEEFTPDTGGPMLSAPLLACLECCAIGIFEPDVDLLWKKPLSSIELSRLCVFFLKGDFALFIMVT